MWERLSTTRTSKPWCARRCATTAPENPAPTTRISVFMNCSRLHACLPDPVDVKHVALAQVEDLRHDPVFVLSSAHEPSHDVRAHRRYDRIPAASIGIRECARDATNVGLCERAADFRDELVVRARYGDVL